MSMVSGVETGGMGGGVGGGVGGPAVEGLGAGESGPGSGRESGRSSRGPSGEEKPSAKQIGREFVRQYYTMLATQSRHVHRFYSHDSTFIHGEGGEPVKGQTAIQREIASLDINSCSAKILKVDSAETLGNGVVIQVIGNLNINGQGYQRFLQTFVLAPQSHKNYYVFNDIFRYDSELGQADGADDLVSAPRTNGLPVSNGHHHPPPPAQQPKAESPDSEEARASPPEADQAVWEFKRTGTPAGPPAPLIPANKPLLDEPNKPPQDEPSKETWTTGGGGRSVGVAPPIQQREGGRESREPREPREPRDAARQSRHESESAGEAAAQPAQPQPPSDPSPAPQPQPPAPVVEHPPPPVPAPAPAPAPVPDTTPKTWANITKKNTGPASVAPMAAAVVPVAPAPAQPPAAQANDDGPADDDVKTPRSANLGNGANGPVGFVPCEIFAGSVPVDMKEEALTEFFNGLFGAVGKVVQVRIRKPASGPPSGHQIAFISVSNQEAVDHILKEQKSPSERLAFPMKHGAVEAELMVTRVREQSPKTGPGGRGGGAMRGAPRGMGPRGGYPNSFSTRQGPVPNAQGPSANPNRRYPPGPNPRPQ